MLITLLIKKMVLQNSIQLFLISIIIDIIPLLLPLTLLSHMIIFTFQSDKTINAILVSHTGPESFSREVKSDYGSIQSLGTVI